MIALRSWIPRELQQPLLPTVVEESIELLALLGYSVATADNTKNTPYLKHLMGE